MTAAEVVNALTGSAILAAAVREGWRWYTARTSRSDAAKAATDGTVAGLLREQIAAGEARAEKGAERAVAIAGALDASARATSDLARAVERIVPALDAIDDRIDLRMEQIDRRLALIEARLSPPTGEHRAGGA